MIDIHHHCLPAVDDGPATPDDSIEQCRLAWREGITTIIATPHMFRGLWPDLTPTEYASLIGTMNRTLGGEPQLLLGSEYFLGHDMISLLEAGRLVTLANSRYLLVELTAHAVPPQLERVFFETQVRNFVPVIAHPERNAVFQSNPELLASLIERGAKTQITAASISGEFGEKAQAMARMMLDCSMVHFVATDAHDLDVRPPLARAVRETLIAGYGEALAANLLERNPKAVVANETLPWDPEPGRSFKRAGLFDRIRRLLR